MTKALKVVRRTDTRPELVLRKELHRRGLRYRVDDASVFGRPDISFRRARVAVFVDGDFWHGGGWARRGFSSFEAQFAHLKNSDFWRNKIQRNVERDSLVSNCLSFDGWIVLRLWESDVLRAPQEAADAVERQVRKAA